MKHTAPGKGHVSRVTSQEPPTPLWPPIALGLEKRGGGSYLLDPDGTFLMGGGSRCAVWQPTLSRMSGAMHDGGTEEIY